MHALSARSAIGERWLLAVYGLGHFGKSLFWNASSIFFAFFLTEIAGMKSEEMGLALGLSLLFNAGMDAVTGLVFNKHVRDPRTAGRVQFLGACLASLGFIAFAATPLAPPDQKLSTALMSLLAFRFGYSIYDVPQNALMAFIARSDSERAVIAAIRNAGAGVSILVVTACISPLITGAHADDDPTRFIGVSIGLAVAALASSLLLSVTLRGPSSRIADTVIGVEPAMAGPARILSRGFIILLACMFAFSLTTSMFDKSRAYFAAYVLKDGWAAGAFLTGGALAKAVVQPAWAWLGAKTSLNRLLAISSIMLALSCATFLVFAQGGNLVAIVLGATYGTAWGGLASALWAILARIAKASPDLTTARFGLFTFVSKSAQAASMFLFGNALGAIDYRDSSNGASLLIMLMATPPLLGAIACFSLMKLRPTSPPQFPG